MLVRTGGLKTERNNQVNRFKPFSTASNKTSRKTICRALSNTLLELESLGLKATSLDNRTSDIALGQLILVLRRISRGISPGQARLVNPLEATPSAEESYSIAPICEAAEVSEEFFR